MSPIELSGRWIQTHTEWLYTRVYENPVFFFDLWSYVHLWSGFMLFAILSCMRSRFIYLKFFLLLLAYEIAEVGFIYLSFHAVYPETFKDQFTDIVVGMAGGCVAARFLSAFNRLNVAVDRDSRLLDRITAYIAVPTVAFLWVGSYQYQYNVTALNNPGINRWALGLWSLGLFATQELNSRWKQSVPTTWIRLSLVWLTYMACLFLIEFIGYYPMGIHEVGRPACPALLLGLIHGTPVLFAFYLTAPFWSLAVQYGLRSLFRGVTRVQGDFPVSATSVSLSPLEDSRDPEQS